jgi:uncharacterized membrane protein
MQLIEIIQLALLVFIAISLVILLFSYLGYRTKSNIQDGRKIKEPDKSVNVSEPRKPDLQNENKLPKSNDELSKQDTKFRVFNPSANNKTISHLKNLKNKNIQ